MVGVGVALLALFVVWQLRSRAPLVPLRLFRTRDFSLACGAISTMGCVVTAMMLPLLYFLQIGRGFDPTVSALFMMPGAVVGGVLAPVVGSRLVGKFGSRWVSLVGFVTLGISLAWYSVYMTPDSLIWLALAPSVLQGVGNACIWSPLALAATHELPPADAGAGTGIYNVTRQIGSVLGSACMGTLMNARLSAYGIDASGQAARQAMAAHGVGSGLPPGIQAGFTESMRQSLWLPAAAVLAGAIIVTFLTGRRSD